MTPGDDAHLVETFVSREELLRGRFLHAVRDTVRLPDGSESTREHVLHPGAVMVVPLLDDGRVVLERQYRHPIGRVMVEFPAGKIDAGEAPFSCARRELLEETGYTAREWARAGVLHNAIAYSTEFIEVWFARRLQAGPARLDEGEFLEVFDERFDTLNRWCHDGTVTDAKTLIGCLWLARLRTGTWSLDWQPAP